MKLGVFTTLYSDTPFKESLDYFKSIGIEMIEIACGGYPGNAHCNPEVLLHDEAKFAEFMKTIQDSGLEVSALSVHSNPVHPDKALREGFQKDMNNAILMAEKMGIHQINTFSGCPGDCENSKYPNWVTCPWPDDFSQILEYQWNEVLIPYWKKKVEFARAHGVSKIAFELHPGFCVYNTRTMLRIRREVGPEIGANFDPSHLIWQGMDPCTAIRELGKEGAIFHFHAKDTKVDPRNTAVNGVLDTTHYGEELERSWIFRTVGYGNGEEYWRNIISELRMAGYDYAVSIEHEDGLMSGREGLEKAISFLKNVLIYEDRGAMYWA